MAIEVISNTKTKVELKLHGMDHTLCNALKTKLHENKDVKIATYAIRHPLIGVPEFLVETTSNVSAIDAFKDASKKLKSDFTKLGNTAEKQL